MVEPTSRFGVTTLQTSVRIQLAPSVPKLSKLPFIARPTSPALHQHLMLCKELCHSACLSMGSNSQQEELTSGTITILRSPLLNQQVDQDQVQRVEETKYWSEEVTSDQCVQKLEILIFPTVLDALSPSSMFGHQPPF